MENLAEEPSAPELTQHWRIRKASAMQEPTFRQETALVTVRTSSLVITLAQAQASLVRQLLINSSIIYCDRLVLLEVHRMNG